ncbi:glycosyltransferase family 4 protein [Staphylococcus simulans]|uniref:glycosyltransferase family 4 protein n=1 Tax=Staphylococcus simulans TaxID=1286 RepID=UPI0021CE4F10|nr:glycosyltransferase family 4 protein [Staphylococcus simulans]UXV41952.1 glycosyltransferase family 4 protein [Staphylococcus simulans]
MKSITFLMHNIYSMGGTVKAVTQLANVLAVKGHKVEIISVFKGSKAPYFKLHQDIEVKALVDYNLKPHNLVDILMNRLRKWTPFLKPQLITQNEPGLSQFSSHVEKKIVHAIQHVETDVLVGTRASYNLLLADYAPDQVLTVGMEHMNWEAYTKSYQQEIKSAYERLNRITVLTDADRKAFKSIIDTPVYVVPNMMNEPRIEIPKKPQIIAAGRLEYEKGFDLLLRSVEMIQDSLREMNFTVHIYGDGQQKHDLEEFISQHQLKDIVQLHPATLHLPLRLAESMITVVPSRNEGFGLVILEAMNQGSIVISFKGNTGPETLIQSNQNGFLAEYQNISSLSEHILNVMSAPPSEQGKIIENAFATVETYSADSVYQDFAKALETSE